MTNPYAWRFAAVVLLGTCALQAKAAITCTVRSSGFTSVYSDTIATPNDSQGTFSVNCTRNSPSTDPITLAYTLSANDGQTPTGPTNNATNIGVGTANRASYELYINNTYTTVWGSNGANFAGTVNFGNAATTFSTDTKTFYARIPQLQKITAQTFTDSVTMTLLDSLGTTLDTNSLPVSIINTPSCQFTTPPGTISFNYTSFQSTLAASTSFAATCTNQIPYTMALDATSGLLLGLNYTLSLSPSSAVGTGLAQSYTISGQILGGQAGTCSGAPCTGTQTHTITVSY